jgi:hypothetical protein
MFVSLVGNQQILCETEAVSALWYGITAISNTFLKNEYS